MSAGLIDNAGVACSGVTACDHTNSAATANPIAPVEKISLRIVACFSPTDAAIIIQSRFRTLPLPRKNDFVAKTCGFASDADVTFSPIREIGAFQRLISQRQEADGLLASDTPTRNGQDFLRIRADINGRPGLATGCPFCPQERTSSARHVRSENCQLLTRAVHMALNSCLPPVVQLM